MLTPVTHGVAAPARSRVARPAKRPTEQTDQTRQQSHALIASGAVTGAKPRQASRPGATAPPEWHEERRHG